MTIHELDGDATRVRVDGTVDVQERHSADSVRMRLDSRTRRRDMRRRCNAMVGLAAALLLVVSTGVPMAADKNLKCQKTIGTAAKQYVRQRLKLEEDCRLAALATAGACTAPDPGRVAKLEAKLNAALVKQCAAADLGALGFPGVCVDGTGGAFTVDDLQECLGTSHAAAVASLADLEVDPDLVSGSVGADAFACQKEIAKSGVRFLDAVLKSVQRCRNAVLAGKLPGVDPNLCATVDAKTAAAIRKARATAQQKMLARCTDVHVVDLQVCEPDPPADATKATACVLDAKRSAADAASPPGLIQHEFPPHLPPRCGDGVVNRVVEECDSSPDDAACPGQCGPANGFFECLCLTEKRVRVVEHKGSDLDIGWTGQSHESDIVEGGGYVTDLWDCDGPAGPDTACIVGPSCSLPPHAPCGSIKNGVAAKVGPPYEDGDAICAALGQGVCRKTRGGATGPHCEIDFKKECDDDTQCTTPGDRCIRPLHGAPLPLTAGGVQVCIHNLMAEDIVGTDDLATGAGSVRIRQISKTFAGGAAASPCPVCGGFCESSTATPIVPGGRFPCESDADCLDPPHVCVREPVCSYGQNKDKPCRPNPPFGGPTTLFGNPSLDCPMSPAALDYGSPNVFFNPATTGDLSLPSSLRCTGPGFSGKVCVGGTSDGRPCTVASECPGGECQNQCPCPSQVAPNACQSACLGGANDAAPCDSDDECPGGFCHAADCRLDPSDTSSTEEGRCTVGPIDQRCSKTTYKSCTSTADCQPSATCPRCKAGEQCVSSLRPCFLNPIVRNGAPGVPDRVGVAVFCIPSAGDPVNGVAGLPGPGALWQPATSLYSGF